MNRDNFRKYRSFSRNDKRYQGNEPQRMTLRDCYINDKYVAEMQQSSLYGVSRFFPSSFNSAGSSESDDAAFYLANLAISDNQFGSNLSPPISRTPPKAMNSSFRMKVSSLPLWTLDENKEIRSDVTLEKVIENDLLICFATDKSGCHFLQSNFYGENTQNIDPLLRDRICQEVLSDRDVFLSLCKNIFGNFFLQRIIEYSQPAEQEYIRNYITSDITALCLDKSACRVVQTALEKLHPRCADSLVDVIPRDDKLMAICTDQNANHVIQKVVKKMHMSKWEFLVDFLCKNNRDNMLTVCQDKYGCRVVQTIVEVLSTDQSKDDEDGKNRVLLRLMNKILCLCQKLASNEFANYVIQHIIETPGVLGEYRDAIIDKCLLRNLLSMSQEKYASHVVERAFTYAPLQYLADMMEEIFDGYVPHPETGKDALDILIFHQFGNYVVQRMLQICCDSVLGRRETSINGVEYRGKFELWLGKLCVRARKERGRLSRFSSGKKILEILQGMDQSYDLTSYDVFSTPEYNNNSLLFSPPTTTTSNDWSRRNSLSSNSHSHDFDQVFRGL